MHTFPLFFSSRRIGLACSTLALSLATLAPAQADVKYTSTMSITMGGKTMPMGTTTTWLKDGIERVDTNQQISVMKMNETRITSAAKRSTITYDPTLKIYVVEPFGSNGRPAPPKMPAMAAGMGAQEKAGTGKMVMTYNVKPMGKVKMLNYMARHNMMTMTMDSSGCCGTGKTALKIEDWRADVTLPKLAYPHNPAESYGAGALSGSKCKVSFEMKGDVKGMTAAQKGLPLKTIVYDVKTGKPISTTQITMLSFAALGNSAFAPPAGFTKVSREEYDKKKQEAMMASMMGGMKAGGGFPGMPSGEGDNG